MIIGVLGAGQLARMLALAGYPLGLRFVFFDPATDACAAPLGEHICAAYDDIAALERFAQRVDCVTFEFENVPPDTLAWLAGHLPVFPSPHTLATARDRMREKAFFNELGIPTPAFRAVNDLDGLRSAVAEVGLPAVLKTCTLGYDGKGQMVLRHDGDVELAWQRLGGVPLILEAFVPFEREVSIIAVRGRSGEVRFYPLTENTHRNGILHLSMCCPGDALQAQAEDYARRLLEKLDYVGVLALELFQADGRLLANEFAPRVHNSGHWTIEGAVTSQFENHLRAVAGLPLGDASMRGCSAMLNLIGTMPDPARILGMPRLHLHDYGKEPRDGRKLGHVTVIADSRPELQAEIEQMLAVSKHL